MSLAIEAFVDNVRLYCEWTESPTHIPKIVRQLLLAMMQGIPYLIVSGESRASEYPRRSYEQWKICHAGFANFPFQYYRQIFNPLEISDGQPVTGDIHDDFADIYDDFWHGLEALNHGDGIYAVNYWRESYFQHWGKHAASAIYALDEYFCVNLGEI